MQAEVELTMLMGASSDGEVGVAVGEDKCRDVEAEVEVDEENVKLIVMFT